MISLRWHHNECHGVPNDQSLGCLFSSSYPPISQKHRGPALLALCVWNPSVSGGFPHKGAVKRNYPYCDDVIILTTIGLHFMNIGSLSISVKYFSCGNIIYEGSMNMITSTFSLQWRTWVVSSTHRRRATEVQTRTLPYGHVAGGTVNTHRLPKWFQPVRNFQCLSLVLVTKN